MRGIYRTKMWIKHFNLLKKKKKKLTKQKHLDGNESDDKF